jgi:predicted RNA-binding protein with PUA-like domain
MTCFDGFHLPGATGKAILKANSKNYWLVKQEPEAYSWSDLVNEKTTAWTGVRNFQARNHLRAMKKGDPVLFYHSVSEKKVVGVAQVAREFYPDPSAADGDWSAVDLVPIKPLAKPVALEVIKKDELLRDIPLVRQSRLSVSPLTLEQFARLLELGGTKVK